MKSEFWLRNGFRVVYEQGSQYVTYLPSWEYDPAWRHTDNAGHAHYWENGAFPTLEPVWFTGWCGACGDDHEPGELMDCWVCPLCGEEITPGTRTVPGGTIAIPGARTITLQGTVSVPVSQAQELRSDSTVECITIRDGMADARICRILTEEEAREIIRRDQEGLCPQTLTPGARCRSPR